MRPRFTNLIFAVLIAGVAVGAAFGGGILYGRNTAPTPKTANAAPAPAGGTGAAAGGAAAGGLGGGAGARAAATPGAGGRGGGGGGGALTGAISKIAGNQVDVTTLQGTVIHVQLASDTRIFTAAEGSVADLKPGLIVIVQGQADASGTVPASAIQIEPLGPGQPNPGATPRPGGAQGGGAQGGRGGQGGRQAATPTP